MGFKEYAHGERYEPAGFDDSHYITTQAEHDREMWPGEEWQLQQALDMPPCGFCVHCGGQFRPRVERPGKPILCAGCNRQYDRERWTWQKAYRATLTAEEIAANGFPYRFPFSDVAERHAPRLVADGRGRFCFAPAGALAKATLWVLDDSTVTYRDE